jgi:hypothetical protein
LTRASLISQSRQDRRLLQQSNVRFALNNN